MNPKSLKNLEKGRFKKGVVTNPLGAGAHNKELKAVRALTHKEVGEVATMILQGNLAGLRAIKDDSNASALKVWFAAVAVKGITRGDYTALGALLDRILGKVPEQYKIESDNRNSTSMNIEVVKTMLAKLESDV